jgi:cell division protein ZapA
VAQVTVTITGKTFRMACDDGQEEHLRGLARGLDDAIEEMRAGFGEIGDLRLTVMSAISILDQLGEAQRRIASLEADVRALRNDEAGVAAAQRVSELAGRVAALADALSKPRAERG